MSFSVMPSFFWLLLSVADLTELVLEILHEGAIRYEFPYCRVRAATQIQVAWRYRKRRLGELTPFFFVCKLRENSLLKRNNTDCPSYSKDIDKALHIKKSNYFI